MSSKGVLQRTIGLVILVALLVGCGGAPAEPTPTPIPISHVYAFGDSFSDNGNYKQLDLSWPRDAYWEGRASNGPTAV